MNFSNDRKRFFLQSNIDDGKEIKYFPKDASQQWIIVTEWKQYTLFILLLFNIFFIRLIKGRKDFLYCLILILLWKAKKLYFFSNLLFCKDLKYFVEIWFKRIKKLFFKSPRPTSMLKKKTFFHLFKLNFSPKSLRIFLALKADATDLHNLFKEGKEEVSRWMSVEGYFALLWHSLIGSGCVNESQ